MPVVSIPTPLRPFAEGRATVEARGVTIGQVLDDLVRAYPELRDRILEGGEVRPFLRVYVNNEDIRYLDELDTAVTDRDAVDIIPSIAGG